MKLVARGHLVDSGLLGEALDLVTAAGGRYEVLRFDIGRTVDEPSDLLLEVSCEDAGAEVELLENLGSLGFSDPHAVDACSATVEQDGVAPEGFYSSTNLATRVRVDGTWIDVRDQRMDAVLVLSEGGAGCVKLRDLTAGMRAVVGQAGVSVVPDTRRRESSDFAFMSGGVSSERRVEDQARQLAEQWRQTLAEGQRVVLVAGPVVVHSGQAGSMAGLVRRGWVDAVLAGNALAVHDVEAAVLGTSLGVCQQTGRPVTHGHMHHMRAINLVREHGGLAGAVQAGALTTGVMHALVQAEVPYCLAGSIRDDGPLPDTEMDLIAAQARYAELLEGAGLVVVLGTMLHGIGVGNMLPAAVTLVCVDINPAVATKLADRGSSHTTPIVTDVGLFLSVLAQQLDQPAPQRAGR
ncbi:MAG: TIGR00300 family protein [Planctomycetota bacterium]|nr:MAG: TIGR00300 family protein [Planctomycetota bacterium]